jgi:hypothetical protein
MLVVRAARLMNPMTNVRFDNYARLLEHFEPHTIFDNVSPETNRYASVAEEFCDEQRAGALIALCETEIEAFGILGESVLDGYAPDGVYGLDTGEKIEVRVSTPVITRAEDQGMTSNPLQNP